MTKFSPEKSDLSFRSFLCTVHTVISMIACVYNYGYCPLFPKNAFSYFVIKPLLLLTAMAYVIGRADR